MFWRAGGRLLLLALIFGAFCLAGNLALSMSWMNDSLMTGITVFGVSFVSIIGAIAKVWYSFWS